MTTWTAPDADDRERRALVLILEPGACPTTREVDEIIVSGARGNARGKTLTTGNGAPKPKESNLWNQ